MPSNVKWRGNEFTAMLKNVEARNLDKAAEFLKSQIQRSMRKGGGKGNVHRSATRKKKGEQYGQPIPRSKPGDPPFVQTGHLRQSVFARQKAGDPRTRQVGTNLPYGVALESGTRAFTVTARNKKVLANRDTGQFFGKKVRVQIAARPFIRPAILQNKDAIARIIADGHF